VQRLTDYTLYDKITKFGENVDILVKLYSMAKTSFQRIPGHVKYNATNIAEKPEKVLL
jgi:hypothetical protein